ncbi:two-component sensor histidine kinase [Cellulomonas sp. WB94]|uniref:sensor histidine kinase n=1 Tax=Cellulomonas sp. WB94 TaxID=2173174 RepID=UPI000D563116|nr:sensor histidine kinase [Cellulomonas sp. WB94]PVU83462.1 two-component sensor histidine kinase [Cellulomonas sp. WB94]
MHADPQVATSLAPAPAPDRAGRRPARVVWARAALLSFVLAAMLTTAVVRQGRGEFPGPTLLVLTVAAWVPLLWYARRPVAALVGALLVESIHLVVVPYSNPGASAAVAMGAFQPVPLATMVAAWAVASRRPRPVGWALGGGAAAVLLLVGVVAKPLTLVATDMVMFNLVIAATAVGTVVSGRRERVVREALARDEETRQQVVAERLRIARELHDVLAHHLTLVNAQAGVADYLLATDPSAASVALRGIGQHTRQALDELRATVGLLRQDDDSAEDTDPAVGAARQPVPGLARLDELIESFRSVGGTVELEATGSPRTLRPDADLAAYRIVQEALTNATKHAAGAVARVDLRWSDDELALSVTNGPATRLAAARTRPPAGSGHGLIGMRERALACGGTLTTERSPAGGFVVRATIPVQVDDGGDDVTLAEGEPA